VLRDAETMLFLRLSGAVGDGVACGDVAAGENGGEG
jgi:hypothetical protein